MVERIQQRRRMLGGLILGLTIVLLAEIIIRAASIPEYILPPPSGVALFVVQSWQTLGSHAALTFLEALTGLVLGVGASLVCSLASASFVRLRGSIGTAMIVAQSTPVIALGPLLSAWLGSGFISKAVLAALVCFPAITVTLIRGLESVEDEEVDLYRSMGASNNQLLLMVRIPRAVPSMFTALQLGVPLAVLGAIVGEFVGASRGLGFVLMTASYYLRTTEMFASIGVAAAGSVILVALVRLAGRRWSWERHVVTRQLQEG